MQNNSIIKKCKQPLVFFLAFIYAYFSDRDDSFFANKIANKIRIYLDKIDFFLGRWHKNR